MVAPEDFKKAAKASGILECMEENLKAQYPWKKVTVLLKGQNESFAILVLWWQIATGFLIMNNSFFFSSGISDLFIPACCPPLLIHRSGGISNVFSFSKTSWDAQGIGNNKDRQLLSLLSVLIRMQPLTLSFLTGCLPSVMCLESFV